MISYKLFTDTGARENNEDNVCVAKNGDSLCFILCDGLGGHGKGEVASEFVCESIRKSFEECEDIDNFLGDAITLAQEGLLAKQKAENCPLEMKTTAVVLVIHKGEYFYGHIGDSRLYVFSKNKYVKRTSDHSVPQMLVLAGDIKEKRIRNHPDRNRLLRVMGIEWDNPRYELSEKETLTGNETFLLCTDGFWELIVEKDMQKTLKKTTDCESWIKAMQEIILKNGEGKNMDNYSAIAVRC